MKRSLTITVAVLACAMSLCIVADEKVDVVVAGNFKAGVHVGRGRVGVHGVELHNLDARAFE